MSSTQQWCPQCDAVVVVLTEHTRPAADRRSITRDKKCERGHKFLSVERVNQMSIDDVLVRRTGDRQLARGAFDRARLLEDVRVGVMKTKRWPEGQDVAQAVTLAIEDLELRIAIISTPLSAVERKERPGFRRAMMDSDVRLAVERQLRRGDFRLAHVLYALSTLGRRDREGRGGFETARQVLAWMDEDANYPDLRQPDLPPTPSVPTDRWWPSGQAPLPSRVIKRDLVDRVPFGYKQFRNSIARALVGRPDAARTAGLVAQWTLWGVLGQQDVLSSQLGSGVLECLRRVDDIAYLRWAAVAKNLRKVREFRSEAVALVAHPSPHLVFDVDAIPRRPRSRPSAAHDR